MDKKAIYPKHQRWLNSSNDMYIMRPEDTYLQTYAA